MLVLGRRHLERLLRAYAAHYNEARPHRGLDLKTRDPRPDPAPWPDDGVRALTCDVLRGLSMSTNSLLEVGSGVCVPFRLERSTGELPIGSVMSAVSTTAAFYGWSLGSTQIVRASRPPRGKPWRDRVFVPGRCVTPRTGKLCDSDLPG